MEIFLILYVPILNTNKILSSVPKTYQSPS